MVALLREGSVGDPTTAAGPPPGLTDLAELFERSRSGGLAVDTDIALCGDEFDRAQQLVVYRVVQESLSNVLQHSPGASCTVILRPPRLEIANEPTPTGPGSANSVTRQRSGLGLIGMAERVRAAGGTFDAGPTAEGGWRSRCRTPTHEEAWAATT